MLEKEEPEKEATFSEYASRAEKSAEYFLYIGYSLIPGEGV